MFVQTSPRTVTQQLGQGYCQPQRPSFAIFPSHPHSAPQTPMASSHPTALVLFLLLLHPFSTPPSLRQGFPQLAPPPCSPFQALLWNDLLCAHSCLYRPHESSPGLALRLCSPSASLSRTVSSPGSGTEPITAPSVHSPFPIPVLRPVLPQMTRKPFSFVCYQNQGHVVFSSPKGRKGFTSAMAVPALN